MVRRLLWYSELLGSVARAWDCQEAASEPYMGRSAELMGIPACASSSVSILYGTLHCVQRDEGWLRVDRTS